MIVNICRALLAMLGIPGNLSKKALADLCEWYLDSELGFPFCFGGMDYQVRSIVPSVSFASNLI